MKVLLLCLVIGIVAGERDLSRFTAGRPSQHGLANQRVQLFNSASHHQARPQVQPGRFRYSRDADQHKQLRPFQRPQRPQTLPANYARPHARPAILPARITRDASKIGHDTRPSQRHPSNSHIQTKPAKRPSGNNIPPHLRPQVEPAPIAAATLPAEIPPHLRPQVQPGPNDRPQILPGPGPIGAATLPGAANHRSQLRPQTRPAELPSPHKLTKPFPRPHRPNPLPAQQGGAATLPAQLPPHLRPQVQDRP